MTESAFLISCDPCQQGGQRSGLAGLLLHCNRKPVGEIADRSIIPISRLWQRLQRHLQFVLKECHLLSRRFEELLAEVIEQVIHLHQPCLDLTVALYSPVLRVFLSENAVDQLRLQMIDVSPGGILDRVDMLKLYYLLQEALHHRFIFPFDEGQVLASKKVAGVNADQIKKGGLTLGVAQLL